MRIGIDARPLAVPSGGIRRYTEEIIEGLDRLDGDHHCVLYQLPKNVSASKGFASLDRDPIQFRGKRFVDALHVIGARKRVDVYHGTNYTIPLLTRIPTVVTVHDLTVQLAPEAHPVARRLRHRLLPAMCRRATRVIADSRRTRDDLMHNFQLDEHKIDVIPLGVSPDFHAIRDVSELARVRSAYGLPERFALYLGALEPRKNLEALIDAFAQLRRDGVERFLALAGTGAETYQAELLAHADRAGLVVGRDVIFPGHVEESDLPALYSASDLFVFPSRYEGFGLPPLEAMACGVPVVLAGNSSLLEVFEGACRMFEGESAKAIANAVRSTLDDEPGRAEQVRRGLDLARSRSWDSVCVETLAVYERAVEQAGATRTRLGNR